MRPVETRSSVPLGDEVSLDNRSVSDPASEGSQQVCGDGLSSCVRTEAAVWTRGRLGPQSLVAIHPFDVYRLLFFITSLLFLFLLLIIFILLWFSTSQLVNKSISVAGVYFLFIVAEEL